MGVHPFHDLKDIEKILKNMHPTFLKSIVFSQILFLFIFISYLFFKMYTLIYY